MSIACSATRRRITRAGLGATTACVASAMGLQAGAQAVPDKGATEVGSVVVTARKPGIAALPEKIQNTAQSINVLPKEVLQQQGVASLQDALKNIPGITLNSGEGGSHGDTVNLRGFPANDDFFIDGLRDTGFYTRDAFDLESVEVYKGPASTLFGRGSTGGVINQVSKTPQLSSFEAGSVTVGSAEDLRATADVNYALGGDAALRLNAMDQSAGVVDRDFVKNRRWGVAPSLALGIGDATSLTLNYLHQQQDDVPDYGLPFVAGRPAPVNRSNYYGLPNDDVYKSRIDVGAARFTHEFSDALSFTEIARVGEYWFDSRETAPHYDPAKVNAVPVPTASTPLADILIYRDRPSAEGTVRTEMSESELAYRFKSGIFANTLTAGLDIEREDADLVRFANQISSGDPNPADPHFVPVPASQYAPTSLLNPNPFEAGPGHQTAIRQLPSTGANTYGVSLVDSLDIGEHWNVVAAVRFDQFDATFSQPVAPATSFGHTDNITSPRLAAVYKPTENQSYYLSYGTSFDPSAESLSLSASNQALPPEKDRTFEAGAKWVLLNGKLSATAAVFDTEMTNARVADPTNPSLQSLAGNVKVNGAELGAQGYLTDKIEVLAGYTYLEGYSVGLGGAGVRSPVQNMARNAVNLWSLYEFTEDFKVGFGANYLDRRIANIVTPAVSADVVPSYVTFDGMVSYRLNPHFTVQLNGYNLTNKLYFTNSYDSSTVENHVIPGAGRTITLTLSARY